MVSVKDKIGYIRRSTIDGKETFKFIEAKVQSVRVGKTKTSVYTDRLYALDAEEIDFNTKIISGGRLILVNEPFVTNEEYSAHCQEVVDYWNEHGAKSLFDDIAQKGE